VIFDSEVILYNESAGAKAIAAQKLHSILSHTENRKYNVGDSVALKHVIEVINQNNLIIEKTGKGNSVVILHKSDYLNKCYKFIKDNELVKLPGDPTPKFQRDIKTALKSASHVFNQNETHKHVVMNPLLPRFF
jgi:hypothetical protein